MQYSCNNTREILFDWLARECLTFYVIKNMLECAHVQYDCLIMLVVAWWLPSYTYCSVRPILWCCYCCCCWCCFASGRRSVRKASTSSHSKSRANRQKRFVNDIEISLSLLNAEKRAGKWGGEDTDPFCVCSLCDFIWYHWWSRCNK